MVYLSQLLIQLCVKNCELVYQSNHDIEQDKSLGKKSAKAYNQSIRYKKG